MSNVDDFSGPLRITGETDYQGNIIAPSSPNTTGGGIANPGNPAIRTTDLWLLGGGTTSIIIPGSVGLNITNNANTANNLSISDSGNVTIRGVMKALLGFGLQGGTSAGSANTMQYYQANLTGIPDTTPTKVLNITIPNVACSAVIELTVRTGITTAAHIYDSTTSQKVLISVTRVPGAAAVAAIGTPWGTAEATSSGGRTVVCTVSLDTVVGAVGASNSIAILVANVCSVASTTDTSLFGYCYNDAAGGVSIAYP